MHDKHQGSDLSGTGKEILFSFLPPRILGKEVLFHPPRYNFILKNQIVIKEINADCSPIDTGERSAFSVFYQPLYKNKEDRHKKFSGIM